MTADLGKTNWSQSVGGVCIRDGKVLLARHTYGAGKGMLIIPGGYVDFGETPEETLVREYLEETGVTVKAGKLIRCAVTGEGFELIPYESKTPGRNLYSIPKDCK